jgi:hypothetical protein
MQKQQQEVERMTDQYEKAKMEQKLMEDSLQTLFRVGKLDIETTVRRACEAFLKDPSVASSERKRRIEALKVLGKVWENTPLPPKKASVVETLGRFESTRRGAN